MQNTVMLILQNTILNEKCVYVYILNLDRES